MAEQTGQDGYVIGHVSVTIRVGERSEKLTRAVFMNCGQSEEKSKEMHAMFFESLPGAVEAAVGAVVRDVNDRLKAEALPGGDRG